MSVCPGCGRCSHCGHPYPQRTYYPYQWPTYGPYGVQWGNTSNVFQGGMTAFNTPPENPDEPDTGVTVK